MKVDIMSWTPEREECLKKMWLCGEYSAQQIADKLGNVTRNAVIGKANRLKLSKLLEANAANKSKSSFKSTKTLNKLDDAAKSLRSSIKANDDSVKKSKPKVTCAHSKDKILNAPEFLNLKLLDLTDSTCKWPVNDETEKDYCFCGVATEASGPYCEYHAHKAFHTLRRRHRKSA